LGLVSWARDSRLGQEVRVGEGSVGDNESRASAIGAGTIAVKVINHYGDEVLRVLEV
jgi:hypothetical protein